MTRQALAPSSADFKRSRILSAIPGAPPGESIKIVTGCRLEEVISLICGLKRSSNAPLISPRTRLSDSDLV